MKLRNLITLALGLFASLSFSRPRQLTLCNSGFVGTYPDGELSLPAAAATTGQHRLLKLTDTGTTFTECGTGDIPAAYTEDHAEAVGYVLCGRLLGVGNITAIGIASGAITAADFLVAGATGTVRTLPATTGTYYIIGRAIQSAATTAQVPYAPCFPIQRIVA